MTESMRKKSRKQLSSKDRPNTAGKNFIDILKPEEWKLIFSYLDPDSIKTVACVSRYRYIVSKSLI